MNKSETFTLILLFSISMLSLIIFFSKSYDGLKLIGFFAEDEETY